MLINGASNFSIFVNQSIKSNRMNNYWEDQAYLNDFVDDEYQVEQFKRERQAPVLISVSVQPMEVMRELFSSFGEPFKQ